MTSTVFDRARDLIFVETRIWSQSLKYAKSFDFIIDTGAVETVLTPEMYEEVGYSARDAERITVMRSAVGREHGYMARVARFSSLRIRGR